MAILEIRGVENLLPWFVPSGTIYLVVTIVFLPLAIPLALYYIAKMDYRTAGCKKLGLRSGSNLADEHDERYSISNPASGNIPWRVKSLWMYPIKSCKGVELSRGTITGKGIEHDRQFSFAQLISRPSTDSQDSKGENFKANQYWKFITMREASLMANIKTEIWVPDPSSWLYSKRHRSIKSEGVLVIRFPFVPPETGLWRWACKAWSFFCWAPERVVHMPFNPTEEQILKAGYRIEAMQIWKSAPMSLFMTSTEETDPWIQHLRTYLGVENHLALFRVSAKGPRNIHRCAPHREELGYQPTVGFQDAYPLHVLNLASVHDVAKKLPEGVPQLGTRNFRPNIVIAGGEAYSEDFWKRITIGDYMYYVACRTVRCKLPNVNPDTGKKHKIEPDKTLRQHRKIDEGAPNGACLGMQMVPAVQNSQINVGDTINVMETGEHFYLPQERDDL